MNGQTLSNDDLPDIWRDADLASMRGQRWTRRYWGIRLVGSVIAALGGAVAWQVGRLDVAAALTLTGFAVALAAELAAWIHRPDQEWYDARAVAESVKTLAWRYAVGAEPFPAWLRSPEADQVLRSRIDAIVDEVSEWIPVGSSRPLVTPGMEALRSLGFSERRRAYIAGRTEEQHLWYLRKARRNRKRSTASRLSLIVAEVGALALAAAKAFGVWDVNLAGFMGAVIASVAAWVALNQYSMLASAYSVAAKELAIQADRLRTVPEAEWALVAADAEDAISREHTMWLASRAGTPPVM